MRILSFINALSLGGTEKAACRWAIGLAARGHQVALLSLVDGPRRAGLDVAGIPVFITGNNVPAIRKIIHEWNPDAIHAHAPGTPHEGDLLGEALAGCSRIPVVQTNIFGRLANPKENAWTSFRLFISWTSCVQSAHRVAIPLDDTFFRRCSVAVYPLDPEEPASPPRIAEFRRKLGLKPEDVLFGRFSRPDPVKWTDLPIKALKKAIKKSSHIKLLLQENPPEVAQNESALVHAQHLILKPMATTPEELRLSMSSVDVVLHTSSIGESFGYGIAEPMNYGKPVICNPTPWADQAQSELVRHGECGFLAARSSNLAQHMVALAGDPSLRASLGVIAKAHIRHLADPTRSLDRLEAILQAALHDLDNPFQSTDIQEAQAAAGHLRRYAYGANTGDRITLGARMFALAVRCRLGRLRRALSPRSNR